MNTLLLVAALHRCPTPRWLPPGRAAATLSRVFAAISLFAIEMQIVTWLSLGTFRSLIAVNGVLAAATLVFVRQSDATVVSDSSIKTASRVYVMGIALLAVLVLTLNVLRPIEAADPYHLDRVAQIERLGTIGYDRGADPKVNAFGWTYELVLADMAAIPVVGRTLLRLHGLIGLAMYVLALAVVHTWLPAVGGWHRLLVLVVPVVFQQLVLIKNDLFGAVPALVVLAWLVMRSAEAARAEVGWASWLAGFAVGVKITNAALAIVLAGTLLLIRRDRWPAVGAALAGGVIGLVCGGLLFTVIENARVYGSPITAFKEAGGMGNRTQTAGDAALSVLRFVISLVDLGRITPRLWPGRGGWGSTFGLPLIWALVTLAPGYRTSTQVRRVLWTAGICFLLFAAMYSDADIAHRLVIAPGLLLIVAAVSRAGETPPSKARRVALVGVIALSALQIVRSAALYLEVIAR